MSYLVLARRFRPQSFDDVIGQEHVTRTLTNAISSGRVAHAFLFAGARGVGKTTTARALAKALNCVEGPTATPCGTCDQCDGIARSRSVDVQEIDGASNNSVDDIRALRETVPYSPSSGRFKIYIVDEVHMLTTSAFNALLKTLEEPPPHVKFVFATTEPHKIPVTILSRCQRYDFRRIPTALILRRLQEIAETEKVEAEEGALALLAREAEGSMRDALSLLDQVLAFDPSRLEATHVARLLGVADRQVLFDISAALLDGDAAGALGAVDQVANFGCDLTRFSHDLLRHLRNLTVKRQCPDATELLDVPDDEVELLAGQVEGRDAAELHRLFLLFARSCEEIARSPYPRLVLEMALGRLAGLEPMRSLEELTASLEAVAAGAGIRGPEPPRGGGPPSGGRPSRPAPSRSKPRKGPPSSPSGGAPARKVRKAKADVAAVPPPEEPRAESSGSTLEVWRKLLRHIESESPPLFHMLRHAEARRVDAAQVTILLPPNPFLKDEARNPQRIGALKAACRAVLGADPEVRLEVGKGEGGSLVEREHIERAARRQDRKREATEHDIVRAALSEFEGAKLQGVKLVDDD